MKGLTQWLTVGIHLDGWKKFLNQSRMAFLILPVFVLFCLSMLGCEAQEGASVGVTQSQDDASYVASPSHSKKVREFPQEETSKDSDFPRIVAFGDSLTAGLGVDPDDAYPGQLARLLREQGLAYEVINAGVSGDTSAGGLRRVEWILKNQPSLVILELGANDGLRGQPLDETYDNLSAIIQRLKAKEVMVVLAGMQLPLNYGADYTQGFSDLFVRLAQEHDVSLIPFFLDGVATQRHLNQGDGLHPNSEGYSIVTENVWRTIQPILKEWAAKG